jgi:hypothetical protein
MPSVRDNGWDVDEHAQAPKLVSEAIQATRIDRKWHNPWIVQGLYVRYSRHRN